MPALQCVRYLQAACLHVARRAGGELWLLAAQAWLRFQSNYPTAARALERDEGHAYVDGVVDALIHGLTSVVRGPAAQAFAGALLAQHVGAVQVGLTEAGLEQPLLGGCCKREQTGNLPS